MHRVHRVHQVRRCAFFGRQAQEDLLEAHAHRAQLEEVPAASDDGVGDGAADVGALLAVHFEAGRTLARVGDADAHDPGDRLQRALHVVNRPLRLHEHRHGAAQSLRQRIGRVGGDDLALADDHDLLAGLGDLREDVRAQDDRVIALERANQLPRLDDLLGIEAGGRLVEHEHFRFMNQRLGKTDALLVALRELAAVAIGHVGDPCLLHHRVDAILEVRAAHL